MGWKRRKGVMGESQISDRRHPCRIEEKSRKKKRGRVKMKRNGIFVKRSRDEVDHEGPRKRAENSHFNENKGGVSSGVHVRGDSDLGDWCDVAKCVTLSKNVQKETGHATTTLRTPNRGTWGVG